MKTFRILIAKPGLDGHDRGAKVIVRALRDAGFEVIYTGIRQTPEMIAQTAVPAAQTPGLPLLHAAPPPGLPSSTWPLQSLSTPSQVSSALCSELRSSSSQSVPPHATGKEPSWS